MRKFDETKGAQVETAYDGDGMVRVFCNIACRADWRNGVYIYTRWNLCARCDVYV